MFVPNIRSKDQVMIGCWVDDAFSTLIDNARGSLSRSQFCRDALKEKLVAAGYDVESLLTTAPDRTGKGGPKKVGLRQIAPKHLPPNEKPVSSNLAERVLPALKAARVASGKKKMVVPHPTPK